MSYFIKKRRFEKQNKMILPFLVELHLSNVLLVVGISYTYINTKGKFNLKKYDDWFMNGRYLTLQPLKKNKNLEIWVTKHFIKNKMTGRLMTWYTLAPLRMIDI